MGRSEAEAVEEEEEAKGRISGLEDGPEGAELGKLNQ